MQLRVELSEGSGNSTERAYVNSSGVAEFYNIPEGNYVLVVKGESGEVIETSSAIVLQSSPAVSVRIGSPVKNTVRPVQGTISVKRLSHQVPKNARKEFVAGEKKFAAGDISGSIAHLQKAIQLDPEFAEAHNNLGSRYLSADKTELALQSYKRALELDPDCEPVIVNVAIAHLVLGHYADAEAAARRALAIRPSDKKAHYFAGLAMYSQNRFTPETVMHLNQAADEFPNARFVLAVVHAQLGEFEIARGTLTAYIKKAPPEKRRHAEAMLAQLPRRQ